jgi:hypothetical protein
VLILYTNADITLYLFKDNKYTRKEVEGVFWDESKASNVIKSGLTTADSVKIFIPLANIGELNITTGKDIVVYGIVVDEIDNTSQSTQSVSLKALKDKYNFVTASSFDKKLYGSPKMQHYALSCK